MSAVETLAPPTEYAAPFAGYVARVPEPDLLAVLREQVGVLRRVAAAVPPARETWAYEPGKWTVREVFGHLADAERVFGYRAVAFARREPNEQPGFDEDVWAANAPHAGVPLAEIVEEIVHLRESHVLLFGHLRPEDWTKRGVANRNPITVRAVGRVLVGHMRHHLAVLDERYGVR